MSSEKPPEALVTTCQTQEGKNTNHGIPAANYSNIFMIWYSSDIVHVQICSNPSHMVTWT
jgi:hypothetical protein